MDYDNRTKLTHLVTSNKSVSNKDIDYVICNVCKEIIKDEFYLIVGSKIYHESCLHCAMCQIALNKQSTCFLKGIHILCRQDYYRYLDNKCSSCNRFIYPNDWIRRAHEHVYHLTCFACFKCGRQLSTGEEYALENSHVLCKLHTMEENQDQNDANKQCETKRIRTTFTLEQLQILEDHFKNDPNPDGEYLGWIAQLTGLSKRVTQIWFQNTRARQKKVRNKRFQRKTNHTRDKQWKIQNLNINQRDTASSIMKTNNINLNLQYSKVFKQRNISM